MNPEQRIQLEQQKIEQERRYYAELIRRKELPPQFVVKVEYDDIIEYYGALLHYLVSHSDYFSLITHNKKPYSKRPPICTHDALLEPLLPFLVWQEIGIKSWADGEADDNHTVMNVYSGGKAAHRVLCTYDNFFDRPDWHGLPEDLNFYRGKQIWFSAVTHERQALLFWPTMEDILFFQEAGIGLRFGLTARQWSLFELPIK